MAATIPAISTPPPDQPPSRPERSDNADETVTAVEVSAKPRSSVTPRKTEPTDSAPAAPHPSPDQSMLPRDEQAAQPVTSPAGSESALFKVQAGAFASKDAAERVADQLKSAGFSPVVVSDDSGGRLLYEVQVGVFRSRDNAEKAAQAVRSAGVEVFVAEQE